MAPWMRYGVIVIQGGRFAITLAICHMVCGECVSPFGMPLFRLYPSVCTSSFIRFGIIVLFLLFALLPVSLGKLGSCLWKLLKQTLTVRNVERFALALDRKRGSNIWQYWIDLCDSFTHSLLAQAGHSRQGQICWPLPWYQDWDTRVLTMLEWRLFELATHLPDQVQQFRAMMQQVEPLKAMGSELWSSLDWQCLLERGCA